MPLQILESRLKGYISKYNPTKSRCRALYSGRKCEIYNKCIGRILSFDVIDDACLHHSHDNKIIPDSSPAFCSDINSDTLFENVSTILSIFILMK